jgi:hypothetical protein
MAFNLALLHPLLNRIDLLRGEAAFVGKFEGLRLGQPGRHDAVCCDFDNLVSVPLHIGIAKQRKRGGFSRTMAGRTILKNDGSDVAIKG